VAIGLSNSQSGINYQLYNGTSTFGSVHTGTGSAISLGTATAAGSYTALGINASTACTVNMSGSASVSINPVPSISGSIYTVAPMGSITLTGSISGGTWTSGSTSVATIGSSSGVAAGVALGTTVITYTLPTGCYATRTISVTATGHRSSHEGAATETSSNIYVHPNPNKGIFTVSGTVGSTNDEPVYIEVTNMLGQVVYKNQVTTKNGELEEQVQLNNVANAMYILSVRSQTDIKVFHIVVEQ